jgi:hypothetical protein
MTTNSEKQAQAYVDRVLMVWERAGLVAKTGMVRDGDPEYALTHWFDIRLAKKNPRLHELLADAMKDPDLDAVERFLVEHRAELDRYRD